MSVFRVLRHRPFAALWFGMTVSALGDEMSLLTFVWLAYQRTHAASTVAAVFIAYGAPLWIGGVASGAALDRYSKRNALIVDNAVRGSVFLLIAGAGFAQLFSTWMLFVGAAAYGLLRMISLAGVPALIPALVSRDELTGANALESLSFHAAAVVGPAFGGILLATTSGFFTIAIDALTYFAFVGCLLTIPVDALPSQSALEDDRGLPGAFRFVLGVPLIAIVTLMFMCFNFGEGSLGVVLPVYAAQVFHGGAQFYGSVLSLQAAGAVAATLLVGNVATPSRLARSIAALQFGAGCAALGLLIAVPTAFGASCSAIGALSAPMTVWAQTLRMGMIPPAFRGRVFAVLRTFMQATPPLGASFAGFALTRWTGRVVILIAVAMMAMPAVVALASPTLRRHRTGTAFE